MDTEDAPDVSFPRLFAANVHYGAFGELLEGPLNPYIPSDKTGRQGVITHYGQYGELLEGPRPLESGGKDKDKDENKDKDEDEDEDEDEDKNAGSSKSDVYAKSEEGKGTHLDADRGEKPDLGKISSVKLSKA